MTKQELLRAAVLFYFLPKASIFLPLSWAAFIFWRADTPSDETPPAPTHEEEPATEHEGWYDAIISGSSSSKLPGDWL